MIGEIGGESEILAAEFLARERRRKPTVGFIAARPPCPAGAWATRGR